MFRKGLQAFVGMSVSLGLLMPAPLFAAEATLPSSIKDHWSFESETSDQGDKSTGELNGISIVDSNDELFGKVLRFGDGVDKYMRLDNYLETGSGQTAFSLWYRYDTSITGDRDGSAAVLLQHEGDGKSVLTLTSEGKYNTYLNGENKYSTKSIEKGEWQHVTVSFDQEAAKVRYYINGKLDSEQNLAGTKTPGTLALRVGAHKNAGNADPHPLRGDLDELYVFTESVDEDEARAIYAQKGLGLTKRRLDGVITQAQAFLNEGNLAATDPEALTLNQKITAAQNASQNDLDALETAETELKAAYADALAATTAIDLTVGTTVSRTIDPDSIFGINHRYAFNGYGTFDETTMKMAPEFADLYHQSGFGSVRYPGGAISNLFNWKTTLGSKEERKKQIHAFYKQEGMVGIEPNLGLSEISDFADEMDSELIYVYSFARGGAQDAADLIEYLNASVGTNPNGGVDWAAVRAANGHPEPYNVKHFEIGNEPQNDGGGKGSNTSQRYWIEDHTSSESAAAAFVKGDNMTVTQGYLADEENWNKKASETTGEPNLVRIMRNLEQNPMRMNDKGELEPDPTFRAVEDGSRIYVGTDGNLAEWTVVDSLDTAGANDQVCTVDTSTGFVTFGDGVHGKIPAAGQNVYATYTAHRDGFNDISQAMRETQQAINEAEGIEHEVKIYSGWQGVDIVNIENSLGKSDLYDGMTVHPYTYRVNTSSERNFYLDAMRQADNNCLNTVTQIVNALPEGKVPVISEFGIYPNTEPQVRSQTHAMYIARCIIQYVNLGAPYIQKHCLSDWFSDGGDALGPTQQAVIQVVPQAGANTATGQGSYRYFATPSAKTYELFNNGFGTQIRNHTLSESPKLSNNVSALSVLASADEQGNYSILIANFDPDSDTRFNLILPSDATGTKVSVQRMESESLATENSLDNPDAVKITTDETIERGEHTIVRVKKHSLAMVHVYSDANKTQLSSLIDQAEALNEEDYEEFTDLHNRLAQAKDVKNNPYSSQAQVDEKAQRLEHAISSLKKIETLDPSLLSLLVDTIEKADETEYSDSFASLNDDLQDAHDILNDPQSQEEIDAMRNTLHTKWLAQRYLSDPAKLAGLAD